MGSMIKAGQCRLPIDRVSTLATALEMDPAYLLLLALEQMMGNTEAAVITGILRNSVTACEMGWVNAIREASDKSDPR